MRTLQQEQRTADLVIVGGGLSGVCCAITAARQGLTVLLVQDRPVLGGNSSSEVRLWVLGATSHMGNNNRWAREGGVIDEILVENLWRNPEGNPVLFDSILLELVTLEPRITLLLNTAVHELDMHYPDPHDPHRLHSQTIARVRAFCSQNETAYTLTAPLFVDASGDGILGFLAGADFRMGAEASSEFDEPLAPPQPTQELLGHSIYFYTRDTGRPVRYIPPAFALADITRIPRFRELRVVDTGCRLWWLEYGGNLDTIHKTEEIKWELWRVAYGVWNYIKNSGDFPEAANLTLEWMGTIPGKRESRRFLGDIILTQRDLVDQRLHADAVSFGGWAIDLHPADGVFSPQPGCIQWHTKGVYQIPFRSMYSRNIANLFLTGRLISATHIAFGSTRVMATCAHNAQAVAMAAAFCSRDSLLPRDLIEPSRMHHLQQSLLRIGQHIPGVPSSDAHDLARTAAITASSSLVIAHLPSSHEVASPDQPHALLLPVLPGPLPCITLFAQVATPAILRAELWASSRRGNTTPDVFLESVEVPLATGDEVPAILLFHTNAHQPCHLFVIVPPVAGAALHLSTAQLPGVLTLSQKMNAAVAKTPIQNPPPGSGIDTFAFWLPDRRPRARNLAARITPPLAVYQPALIANGYGRPWCGANAWAPAPGDPAPALHLDWPTAHTLRSLQITFDTDFDHPMESVLMTHPEHIMPGCVTAFRVVTREGTVIAEVAEHHQTHWRHHLAVPLTTTGLSIQILGHGPAPPAIFEVRCY